MIKKILFIVLFPIFLCTCSKKSSFKEPENSETIKTNNLESMLKHHSLTKEMFNDSLDLPNRSINHGLITPKISDSLNVFLLSDNGLYTLVTNYNKNTNTFVSEANDSCVYFNFLFNNPYLLKLGSVYKADLKSVKFDYCWGTKDEFYLLIIKQNNDFYLQKIRMESDTIIGYVIRN